MSRLGRQADTNVAGFCFPNPFVYARVLLGICHLIKRLAIHLASSFVVYMARLSEESRLMYSFAVRGRR
ncbi:hypothetical protein B7H01_17125 [Pandoraea apista]|nr:hypothetical protein B7H01_17125 [Pandoraea apista]